MQSGDRHFNTKITEQIASEVFDLYLMGWKKSDIAQKFSVSTANVSAILIGATWKTVYARKMKVSVQEVYDMWAGGKKEAISINWIHLQKLLIANYAVSGKIAGEQRTSLC
jgi:hypothetical protein